MSESVEHVTPDNFDSVTAADGLVVSYFWGPDCPNCEIFARDLPELLTEIPPEVKVIKVNAYEYPDLATRFSIFGIPAFVLFKNGKKLGMMREYRGREFWKAVVREQAAGIQPSHG